MTFQFTLGDWVRLRSGSPPFMVVDFTPDGSHLYLARLSPTTGHPEECVSPAACWEHVR